jgi:ribonuclease HI
MEYIEV